MKSYFAEDGWAIGDVIIEDKDGGYTNKQSIQEIDGERCGVVIDKQTVQEIQEKIICSWIHSKAYSWDAVKALFNDGKTIIAIVQWLDALPADTLLTYQETLI